MSLFNTMRGGTVEVTRVDWEVGRFMNTPV